MKNKSDHGLATLFGSIAPLLILVVMAGCQQNRSSKSENLEHRGSDSTTTTNADPADDRLTLTASWDPFADSTYNFGDRWDTLQNLTVAHSVKSYSAEELAFCLPPPDTQWGQLWKMDVKKIIPVLQQFHAGATHRLHHGGPQGAVAMIDAENANYFRVRCRLHAEFDLSDGKYTPSQFSGEFVVDKSNDDIVSFKLSVPPRRNNVDVNWEMVLDEDTAFADKDGNLIDVGSLNPVQVIADIGYCKKMELVGGALDIAATIEWDRESSEREVEVQFQRKFYNFARIDWLPWEEAVARARETGVPLHVVALFGSLDDESC